MKSGFNPQRALAVGKTSGNEGCNGVSPLSPGKRYLGEAGRKESLSVVGIRKDSLQLPGLEESFVRCRGSSPHPRT